MTKGAKDNFGKNLHVATQNLVNHDSLPNPMEWFQFMLEHTCFQKYKLVCISQRGNSLFIFLIVIRIVLLILVITHTY